ncbi:MULTISPECIES: efflux RND transporter periplasmic adaptor subunit [Marinobacter]|jgi:membrane fusion protein (multidrug efflux system)|uniref:efflux RND transporter periplasmic adaptor subunit n=1 Tax=Marinobacter TaxID=2742 RepID=UPI0003B9085B|nr:MULTISPECIES: efflux RND transporter periplasmic adaptor subunit [Marinobacter]MAH30957.1 efflux RND transporter periplasmic adaptor subunit [Marinobacter sp.]ERS83103.1 RND transporter [Marinobacter sp. C1S70]MAL33474.1 efflux RND transporter periplasmic adaptor subunit [Marinobacter sp.]MAP30943.1 efflux RND transporter periplasmic adaptor subunit [Marinobacter sp.]MBY5936777.1 efflux RND transporter periplasmic adaptor subunit [Marinobacter nauticus]|tara:strand:+ start:713 stop:1888 length:1176 start_codon:yes stop_codon:yes gene_type:complete
MPVEMSHRPNARKGLLFAGLSTLLMLTGCSGQDGEGQQAGAGGMPPAAVVVQQATLADVTVRQDYAGRARGAREVEVRARISGILEQRLYEEGQMVREGDALFRIDRKPAAAALQRARAQRQVAEADVQQAEREWNRISSLFERNAVSERDRDSAQSALELARANLAVANAGVAQAELDLGYTDVTAPISGVTSLEDFPEGSLIDTGTLLTTIVQLDPVHVRFALPENDANIRRAAREGMVRTDQEQNVSARLVLADGSEYDLDGRIDFTASTLDPRTGTVSARAVFPNPEQVIVPGQFVRVRVELQSFDDVITVPERAVTQGQNGPVVYVVDDDSKARVREVELGPVSDGRQILLSGLDEGDRYIVSGLVNLRDGAAVNVTNPDSPEEAN